MNNKILYEQFAEPLSDVKQPGMKRKLVTDSLANSEMRYRRLFETAKDGILILDPKTAKIIDANPFIVNILEYPLEQIIGKQLWEIGLFRNMEESKLAFKELKKNRYIRFDDMPLQQMSGRKVEVEFVSNVYEVNNTDVIQCNIRDISERIKAEKALRENEHHLKEQNIEFTALNKGYLALNEELTKSINHIKKMNQDLILAKNKAEESDNLKSSFLANISHEMHSDECNYGFL
jgi:PAS domain S-box-containing protein